MQIHRSMTSSSTCCSDTWLNLSWYTLVYLANKKPELWVHSKPTVFYVPPSLSECLWNRGAFSMDNCITLIPSYHHFHTEISFMNKCCLFTSNLMFIFVGVHFESGAVTCCCLCHILTQLQNKGVKLSKELSVIKIETVFEVIASI